MGVRGNGIRNNLRSVISNTIDTMKNIRLGIGNECPKCFKSMERRGHKEINNKIKKMSYYYTSWDYCISCKHLQHYEANKKFNLNRKAEIARFYEEQTSIFNNL